MKVNCKLEHGYASPEIQVIDIATEQTFAMSADHEGFGYYDDEE